MSKNNMNLEEKKKGEEMEERKIKRTDIKLENIFAKEHYVDNDITICKCFLLRNSFYFLYNLNISLVYMYFFLYIFVCITLYVIILFF